MTIFQRNRFRLFQRTLLIVVKFLLEIHCKAPCRHL